MKNKLLVTFNTCGLGGRENVDFYISSLESILKQNFDNYKVIISSCCNTQNTKNQLKNHFNNKLSYNFIDYVVPVNVSFNQTVQKSVDFFGEFDGYVYVDSGITFDNDINVLSKLYDLHISNNCAMTSARIDTDAGTWLWYKEGQNQHDESGQESLFRDGHFEIPVGKTTNLHVQLFDNSIYQNFNKKIVPDIFASHCTESVFSFICAALKKKFYIHKDVFLRHNTSMDGASSGFRPERHSFPPWQHTFALPSPETILNLINNPEAKECGFGYEECQNVLLHDPDKFDENGYAKKPEKLKEFILKNVYLSDNILDYSQIESDFIE